MKYVMLISALHYRFSTLSTAVYCRYPSDPVYKYLRTYTTAKYEELALEIWLACHNSAICLCICIRAYTHRYLHLSTCTSICPSICPSMYHSVYLPLCLSVSVWLSVRFPVSLTPSVCLSVYLSINPPIHPSINPSIQLLSHLTLGILSAVVTEIPISPSTSLKSSLRAR